MFWDVEDELNYFGSEHPNGLNSCQRIESALLTLLQSCLRAISPLAELLARHEHQVRQLYLGYLNHPTLNLRRRDLAAH